MTTEPKTFILKCKLEDKIKNVCKKFALYIGESYKHLTDYLQ